MCLMASSVKPCLPVVCENEVLVRVDLSLGGGCGVSTPEPEPEPSVWVQKEWTYLEYPSAPSMLVLDHVRVAIKQVNIIVGGCVGQ
jgi:hypothetical protein